MQSDRSIRGYRRTAATGLLVALLVLAGLPAPGSPAGAAEAVEAERAAFTNGTAKATALITRVAPGVGSLELAISQGIAVSQLQNNLTQAQAQTLDLGLIGTTLTAEGCGDAILTADQLPQPTRVDNRKGDAHLTEDEAPLAGSTLGVGRRTASATGAGSQAIATLLSSIGDVISISGAQAEATTEVIDGAARQAHSTVEVDLTLAGVVKLGGLRWEALHRTGKDPKAEASFDIGTAKSLGFPIATDSLVSLESTLNALLEQTGLSITFPKVERFKEPTDLIRVTPLRIVLKDSPLGKLLLGPVLNLTREQRSQLFDELTAAVCEAAAVLLVGDVGVQVLAGTGFLAVEIGGAEAISGDLVLGNPFGPPVAPSGPTTPPASGGSAGVPSSPSGPSTPITPSAPPSTDVATDTDAPRQPVANIGPLEELCETIHPFAWPDCSEGAMAPLGLMGLIATLAVGALDWRHQRRRLQAAAPAASGAPE